MWADGKATLTELYQTLTIDDVQKANMVLDAVEDARGRAQRKAEQKIREASGKGGRR